MTQNNTQPTVRRMYTDAVATARLTAAAEIDTMAGNSREAWQAAVEARNEAVVAERAALGAVRKLQGDNPQFDRSGDGGPVPLRGSGVSPTEFDAALDAHAAATQVVRRAESRARAEHLKIEDKALRVPREQFLASLAAARDAAYAEFVKHQIAAAVSAHRLAAFSSALGEDINQHPGDRGTTLSPLNDLVARVEDGMAYGRARKAEREALLNGANK